MAPFKGSIELELQVAQLGEDGIVAVIPGHAGVAALLRVGDKAFYRPIGADILGRPKAGRDRPGGSHAGRQGRGVQEND